MPARPIAVDHGNDNRQQVANNGRPFGRRRSMHQVFGRGKVADIVLWRNKQWSAAILAGVTVTWFLFEVVEYPFLTLLCQFFIVAMLLLFIWSNVAAFLDRSSPKIPYIILSERAFKDIALSIHSWLNHFLTIFQNVAMGRDLKLFLLAIVSLWILSMIGSFCSILNILYFGYLCIQILPVLYERYEGEVDHLAFRGSHDLQKLFLRFDNKVLKKIPRGPIKEMKYN